MTVALIDGRDEAPEPGSFDADEDAPRADIGYQETERPPPPTYSRPVVPVPTARGVCRDCQEGFEPPGVALFARLGSVERTLCATCSGKDNLHHVDMVRETIRALKAAAACGNAGDERECMARLKALVGEHQAAETVKGIRERLNEPSGRGRR